MKIRLAVIAMLAGAAAAQAADVDAGKDKVATVCAACHGANGVSVAGFIPNLAGQKGPYLSGQLQALKAGERKSDIMNPIARQLSDADIENIVAFLSGLPGAAADAAPSALLPGVAETRVRFPADYKSSFRQYMTMDFPDAKQVRHFYANPAALRAAKEGKPLPDGAMILVEVHDAKLDDKGNPVRGSDGYFAAGELKGYAAMERQAGWGDALPEMLRNENWNYAPLTTAGAVRTGFNQATCFACHKPRPEESYLFTLKELKAFAQAN